MTHPAPAKSDASNSNEWETSQKLFDALNERFGPFDCDVAAAPGNAKCAYYLTKRRSAFRHPWGRRNFGNFPYSRGNLDRWMPLARAKVERGLAEVNCCVVPAYTCEGWWHRNVEAPAGRLLRVEHHLDELGAWTTYHWQGLSVTVGRLRGRQRFVEASGKTGSARFSSAVVVYTSARRNA